MEIFKNYSTELKLKLKYLSQKGSKIGFVPTMGFLHDGHLALIKKAKEENDMVIASIFVNEKQFNNKLDFLNYPINLASDLKKLSKLGVDIAYIPESKLFYVEPFYAEVNVKHITDKLCGSSREGHFSGVALVLTKFFNQLRPDNVYLGLKDYQQFLVVSQLVRDLDMGVNIKPVETFRENTGLALSSRNSLLTMHERNNIAPKLYFYLRKLAQEVSSKPNQLSEFTELAKANIVKAGFTKIEYLEILNNNLESFNNVNDARIFVAAIIGKVRLIDNLEIC